jgi:hypothetical protein
MVDLSVLSMDRCGAHLDLFILLKPEVYIGNCLVRLSDNSLFRAGVLFAGANHAWRGNQLKGIDDGTLTAYEVSNLFLPNIRLVCLICL